jgi:hypothetical protein
MINSFILFCGLLVLFFLGKISFYPQILILISLIMIAQINNLSVLKLIIKIKYFLLALIIIYPLTTPGELLFFSSFISISYEGLLLAITNICRVVSIFFVVMILLSVLPKDFFLRFLIKTCYPLKAIGVNIERLTARLYLTFEYLEIYKKYNFKFSSISNDITKQLNIKDILTLDRKIYLIQPTPTDFLWLLFFIVSIYFLQYLM